MAPGLTQSANGARAHDNVYMVNGIMASEPWTGQSIFNAVMAAGDAGTLMPVDAIDEFKTEENPRAEYGWKPGAIVNVGIKSGTNAIHGSAYAYGRDTAFDARNYFNPGKAPNPTKRPSGAGAIRRHSGRPDQERQAVLFCELMRASATASAIPPKLKPFKRCQAGREEEPH